MAIYNKTQWSNGDVISTSRLQKIEDQLEAITPGATNSIQYDVEQTLTAEQKSTARQNIDAFSAEGIGIRTYTFTDGKYYNLLNREFDTTQNILTHDSYKCAFIPCSEGDIFYLKGGTTGNPRLYAFLKQKVVTETDEDTQTTTTTVVDNVYTIISKVGDVIKENIIKIIIPAETEYLAVNFKKDIPNILFSPVNMAFAPATEDLLNGRASKWNGKKVAFIGDSITAGTNRTLNRGKQNTYHKFLNDKINFGDMYISGVAGSCYSTKSNYGNNNSPIVTRWKDNDADIGFLQDRDLIVLFAGTNDWGHNTPLGEKSEVVPFTGTLEELNGVSDTSFYSALNIVVNKMMMFNPGARLVLMTPLRRGEFRPASATTATPTPADDVPNGQGLVLKDYVEAIKYVGEYYSIPVIDLYSTAGLSPKVPAIYNSYYKTNNDSQDLIDYLHPNYEGHKLLADRIGAALETM